MCFDIGGFSNKLYRRMSNKVYRKMSNKLYRRVVQQILLEGCPMDVDVGDCPMSFKNKNLLF